MTTIIGIKLDNRLQTAVKFQEVITNYGCEIKTRLGLHKTTNCENYGIIILDVEDKSAEEVSSALSEICLVQKMVF